jgi:hypothetical protein
VAKRAILPRADELLIGRPVDTKQANPSKEEKSIKTTVLKSYSAIDNKEKNPQRPQLAPRRTTHLPKTQTSIHLTTPTIKRIEEVKYRLLAEYDVKAKKSTIVEQALKAGLANLEQLAQALRQG